MQSNSQPSLRSKPSFLTTVACLMVAALSLPAAPSKVHLSMRFTPGEILRYQIETSTTTNNKMEAPMENPEAASKSTQSVSLILRLDVLNAPPANGVAAGSVRIRTTFEKSDAAFKSDAFDLAGSNVQDQYKHLEGRSLEYTMEPGGQVSHITGIDDLLANPVVAENVHAWMNGLSFGARLPKGGIELGQKWNTDQPMEGTPLGGLVWRNRSTYLNNEPCSPHADSQKTSTATPSAAHANLSCAVVVTEFKIVRNGDATPDDYSRKGLDTSGTWTGSGGSLEYISLADGTLMRSTQNSTQNMDVQILRVKTGSKIHYFSRVDSKSEISLLPTDAPSTAPQP